MQIPAEKVENFTVPEKDDYRSPVMKSCWLDVAGKRLMATDGHMAIRVSVDVAEEDVSGLIPVDVFVLARKELKIITKMQGKETIPDTWISVICNDAEVLIQNLLTNTTHLVKRPQLGQNEKFPGIDSVFPKLSKGPNTSLMTEKVQNILKSLDPLSLGVSAWIEAPEKGVVLATGTGKASVMLMPMRQDMDPKEVNQRGMAAE